MSSVVTLTDPLGFDTLPYKWDYPFSGLLWWQCLPGKAGKARVVELVDTLDLGSSALGIRVQVPSLA